MAVTASRFNKLPSEMLGILDESIALAFDVECAAVLFKDEQERETARLTTQLALMFTGTVPQPKAQNKKFSEQTF